MLMDTANANNIQTASSGGGSQRAGFCVGRGGAWAWTFRALIARNGQDAHEKGAAFWANDDEDVAAVVDAAIEDV
ncbi:MAG: hypothetical protein CM15mP128_3260 [Methanobacteriota archaeon]|nr:MAG: hypothetical protein CM15mP128_3260 [Euryarchaeota archaeon]